MDQLKSSVVALVMSPTESGGQEAAGESWDAGLEEYLDWLQRELLCSELELMSIAALDREEVKELEDRILLLIWTPTALASLSDTDVSENSILSWLQEDALNKKVVNLFTELNTRCTPPHWAVFFQQFFVPMNSSTAALGAYLKQEPSAKLFSSNKQVWQLKEQQARDLLEIAKVIDLDNLHRLLPHVNRSSSDRVGRVLDGYRFKTNKNLLWYMLNVGFLRPDSVTDDLYKAITEHCPELSNKTETNINSEFSPEQRSDNITVSLAEHPKSQGYRFRYECEGYTHGGIPGESSERGRKTHPSLQFTNYEGKVVVVGYLLGEEGKHQHANSLVGRDVYRGVLVRYGVVSAASPKMELSNISIQHCKKKMISQSAEVQLQMRKLVEKIGVDAVRSALSSSVKNTMNGDVSSSELALKELMQKSLTEEDYKAIKNEQEKSVSTQQNLSAVKLSLIVYTQDARSQFTELTRLITHCIYDSQSVHSSSPRICRVNVNNGQPGGDEEIMILCEKIQKSDIEVIFSQEHDSVDKESGWYVSLDITSNDVHHQYAVLLKTPAYIDTNLETSETVFIRLRRKSDNVYSNAVEFTYDASLRGDPEGIGRKRLKAQSLDQRNYEFN